MAAEEVTLRTRLLPALPLADAAAGLFDRAKLYALRRRLVAGEDEWTRAAQEVPALLRSKLVPYLHQLRAVRRVSSDPSRRYLLADEVGLGKTVEAGLIMRTLFDDGCDPCLVIVPDELRDQWREEMRLCFGLGPPWVNVLTYGEFIERNRGDRPIVRPLGKGATSVLRAIREKFQEST